MVVMAVCPLAEPPLLACVEVAGAEDAGFDVAGAALPGPAPFEELHAPSRSGQASPITRLWTMRRGIKDLPFVGIRICLLPQYVD
jgi:hypothetical protein